MTNTEVKVKAKYTYQPKQSAHDWQMYLLSPRIVVCYPDGDVNHEKATARIGCESRVRAFELADSLQKKQVIERYEIGSVKRNNLQEFVSMPQGVKGCRKAELDLKVWGYNYNYLAALAQKDWEKFFADGITLKFGFQPDYCMVVINNWVGIWLEKEDACYLQANWDNLPQEDQINVALTWVVLPQAMLDYLQAQLPKVVEIAADDCEF